MEETHRVHGIPFNRKGECNRCDGCRKGCLEDCPHGMSDGGKPFCGIHETRHLVCRECSEAESQEGQKKEVTHQVCIDFPDHPWLDVIKRGVCNYQFTRLDEEGNVSDEPLPFMDLDEGTGDADNT